MRRTERAAYRTKFYSNLSSPTQFDEEPKKYRKKHKLLSAFLRYLITQADKPFSTKVLPDTPASGR
ncbi:hypothetical protein EXW17_15580 [Enterococcus faecium]|nr:hypothetical protein [Enterococcus faecium]